MASSGKRYVSCSFWDDPWVQELDVEGKLLYMYLLTTPLSNIAGIFEITKKRIVLDTGIPMERVKNLLGQFGIDFKASLIESYIVMVNWPKHQNIKSGDTQAGIIRILLSLPDSVFSKLKDLGYSFDLSLVPRRNGSITPPDGPHKAPISTPGKRADHSKKTSNTSTNGPHKAPITPTHGLVTYSTKDLTKDLTKDSTQPAVVEKIPDTQEAYPPDSSPFGIDDTSPTSWPTDWPTDDNGVEIDLHAHSPSYTEESDIPDDEPTPAQKLSIAQGYWQEKGITPECRKLSPNWEPHKAVEAIKGVSLYKVSEIKDAINNLRIIQDHPDSYNQFKWELENFLARGMARYLTSADPLTNFLKPGFKKVSSNIRICKYCGEPAESEYRMFTCVKCGYNQVEDIEIFKVRMFGTEAEKEKFFAKPEEISAMVADMRKKLGG